MIPEHPQNGWRGAGVALLGTIVLTAFASVAPAGVRKIVLFAVAYGAGIGGIVAYAARRDGGSRRVVQFVVPLLVVVGLTFVAIRTHHDYRALQQAENRAHPERLTPAPMLETIAANDPQTADMLRRRQSEADPDFLQYLAVRTRPLGEWPPPWPLVLWCAELLLAVVAGLLVAGRMFSGKRLPGEVSDGNTDS